MIGKLTPDELRECVLSVIKKRRKEVVKGSASGCDSAALRTDELLLLTTDPITGGADYCGKLAVHVCCNDIAAAGGEPMAILVTVLAPENAGLSDIKRVMTDVERESEKLNVEVIGGHSEFTDAVNRTVVSATVVGIKSRNFRFVPFEKGQSVMVTKTLGLEGTSVIAESFAERVRLSDEELAEAKSAGNSLSVVADGRASVESGAEIAAMHDITEGGVLGALCEVLDGSGFGAEIDIDSAPVLAVTKKICAQLSLDPYRLLSSGSMLIVTSEPEKVEKALSGKGIASSVIGKITDGKGVFVNGRSEAVSVKPDEIYKLFKEI